MARVINEQQSNTANKVGRPHEKFDADYPAPHRMGSASVFLERNWILILGIATVVMFVVLAIWKTKHIDDEKSSGACLKESISFYSSAKVSCGVEISRFIELEMIDQNGGACQHGDTISWLCSLRKMSKHQLFIWADNFFVDMYTIFFLASSAAAYRALRRGRAGNNGLLRTLFVTSVLFFLAGGIVDHIENFWLLAHVHRPEESLKGEILSVASLSVWKFRLFSINLAILLAWWFHRIAGWLR